MRTSLNEIAQIERYLSGTILPADRLVLDAKKIVDPEVALRIRIQKTIYALVRLFGRKQLQEDIRQVQEHLFSQSEKVAFQNQIAEIFKDKNS